ncbi:replication initiation protein [Dolichospermum sp. ST_sed3]|nr:replication initiation protein [Dolichospermum sp. ST_sed3]
MNQLTERNYVRQAPDIINGKYSLTKGESDLIYALLTAIEKDDEDFKAYVFTKAELEAKLGIEIHSTQLQVTVESLMKKVIKVKKNEKKWTLFNWFSYFDYDNGIITCRFDKVMKPYYLQLKQYVLVDFRHFIKMPSEYSKRIYLLLKERANFGERKFNIEELMEILEVPESYKIYNRFKEKVLNQAVKDINKHTDIEIKNLGTRETPKYFEEHKFPRKVVEVTFHFKKNINDLKSFIEYIRDFHPNEPLFESKEGKMLKCSLKGLLYYSDTPLDWIDEKDAIKLWGWLHENYSKLYFHAIVEAESIKHIEKELGVKRNADGSWVKN